MNISIQDASIHAMNDPTMILLIRNSHLEISSEYGKTIFSVVIKPATKTNKKLNLLSNFSLLVSSLLKEILAKSKETFKFSTKVSLSEILLLVSF